MKKELFRYQSWHWLFILIALFSIACVTQTQATLLNPGYLGLSSTSWIYIAAWTAIGHHLLVWFVWRSELYFRFISHHFGNNGFTFYTRLFFIFFVGRLVSLILLASASSDSLLFSPLLLDSIAVIISVPMLYTLYSVHRYFGFKRAVGIDHFDLAYKDKPLVQRGIFRYTPNAMYSFGILFLWLPGLLLASEAALWMALFNHIYVWVHYFTLEKPDMNYLYGKAGT